jgi:hypothetical protein
MNERQIIDDFGIDAEGASLCAFCELKHFSGIPCPPVLPVGTEAWGGAA